MFNILRKLRVFFYKKKIARAFKEGFLTTKSVSKDGKIEYKRIVDVLRHYSEYKNIHKLKLENGKSVKTTCDHSVFILKDDKIEAARVDTNPESIIFIDKNVTLQKVVKNEIIKNLEYTYDLSVEENQNFVLPNGILVKNSFSPPNGEATIAGFSQKRGFRWSDEQLYYHLVQAANYINLVPPDTGFSLENYPAVWQPILLQQSMIYALWDLSILWINEEFSYSLNGISLDISRSDKYSGVAQAIQSTLDTQLALGKSRIHIIRGLAQNRHVYGRGASIGPWCLHKSMLVYNLDDCSKKNINDLGNTLKITIKEAFEKQIKLSYSMDENNQLVINEVNRIWYNGLQELYKMKTEKSEIICTETHKFYNVQSEEKMLKELKIGDEIWINENDELILDKIASIDYFGKDETYDMEMTNPYRNYLANDFIVHNTGGQNIRRWIAGSGNPRMGS